MNKIVAEHLQRHAIVEWEHFPDHDKRMETLQFRNAKHELETVEHLGCYICGSMEQRQSHHLFERAFANGMDLKKVAKYLYNHFDFHGHCKRDFKSEEELFAYLSQLPSFDEALDTLYNQLILCKSHHTQGSTGIHGESAPSFFAWLARKEEYEPTFTQEAAQLWASKHRGNEDEKV